MSNNRILTHLDSRKLSIILIVSLISTVVCILLFSILMGQFPIGAGLMDIKNAWNNENLKEIIEIWKTEPDSNYFELMTLVNNIDFLFMIVYSAALYSGLLLLARKMDHRPKMQKFLIKARILSFLAFAFDFIEGIYIAIMLATPDAIGELHAFGGSLVALLCTFALYLGIAFLIIGLLIKILEKKNQT